MKWFAILLLFLFVIQTLCAAQTAATCPPPNIGFEDGTFNNWVCDIGYIDQSAGLHLTPSPPVPDRQTMIDKTYPYPIDFYSGIPSLCPNGSGHSIRLGNGAQDQFSLAESISYTFTVPVGADNYDLIYNYAVVMYNGSPNYKDAPRFTIRAYDVTDGTTIDCASSDFYAIPTLPQWKLGTQPDVYYQDWATASLNLTGYAGKQIRLQFTTNHADHGDYQFTAFGYAYIDVNQDCASPITGNSYCTGQSSVTLTSPPGFYSYVWYNAADLTKPIGHKSTLTISPAPPDQTKYAVVTQSQGCFDTLYTVVSKINAGFVFQVKDTIYTCAGTPVDLTAAAVTAGSSANLTYTYYTDSIGRNYLYNPNDISNSGTYYIKGLNPEGCNYILPVTVIVLDTKSVSVTDPPAVVFPATVDISLTFPHLNNITYSYYSNASGTIITDYQHIGKTGTYYIKAFNPATGCSALAPVHVVVLPPPAPVIQAPNTFTPNNDGINDHFLITIVGYELFKSLKIYNRNGQLIFETKNSYTYWDGTINGKQATLGVYYWVFDGIYEYDNSEVFKGGSITLIR